MPTASTARPDSSPGVALADAPILAIPVAAIVDDPFSLAIYGPPQAGPDFEGLVASIRSQGILVPLVMVADGDGWRAVSGHRRLAAARSLGLAEVPCFVQAIPSGAKRRRAILEHNRQRRKTFSQSMREADALESLLTGAARRRRLANLKRGFADRPERRDSDDRPGRTDAAVARALGIGGKDLYRQARAVWAAARSGDVRARAGVSQLDAGTKTVFAAFKDLRRRDRYTTGFRPTPYDVWSFRHDGAFGIPHPGSIPPGIVAHALHYYTTPGALVVDPMAGGGGTIDVCLAMGRRCLAYDLHPVRDDVRKIDVRSGLPDEASGCDLVFCDPPYHTMLAGRYPDGGAAGTSLDQWVAFLAALAQSAFDALRPGGVVALLLANQTEKDLPAGFGYLDHAFYGYQALTAAGFLPERRVSCPMAGAYLPQQVRRARTEGRMLGQVRDLLFMRKPSAMIELRPGL